MDLDLLPAWANGLIVVVAILVIWFGAQRLVEAAARIAKHLGISELVIGLTVVAVGTSAPEFAVTLTAALKGLGDISVGNIVGSNVFNLGFILGGCALLRAIPTSRTLLRRDGPILVLAAALVLAVIGVDLRLDRHDGILLGSLLVAYLLLLFKQRRRDAATALEPEEMPSATDGSSSPGRDALLLLLGLVLVAGGSRVLVDAATAVARTFGVSEWIIGVTIVAAGTSAPELATTLAGVVKRRFDISAGNLIGSDLFNLLGVLGVAGIVRPVEVDAIARTSLGGLMLMVIVVLAFMRTGWRISRLEGGLLVLIALARWVVDCVIRLG
jgi:cation:H+ antiporter